MKKKFIKQFSIKKKISYKILWDSSRKGTYIKSKHGELK